jgi:hypothetical protein
MNVSWFKDKRIQTKVQPQARCLKILSDRLESQARFALCSQDCLASNAR